MIVTKYIVSPFCIAYFWRMYKFKNALLGLVVIFSFGCSSSSQISTKENGKIEINFLQINDVYEIAPIANGKVGGLARVATVKKELLQKNPNTLMIMAGDFLSPSVYNSLKYKGEGIRGAQMIDALNVTGLDIAIFGNHEFDLKEADLQNRINESNFKWISSNSFHSSQNTIMPFAKTINGAFDPFPETLIMPFKDADGTEAKVGFIGINIPFNKAGYVSYTDPLKTAVKLYNQIKDSCDVVIALTHQAEADDIILAKTLPGLAAIMGGHEHDQRFDKIGKVYITKAHANARSAYILKLKINKNKGTKTVNTKLKMIDEMVVQDSSTQLVVEKWTAIANENYESLGFDAKKIIMTSGPAFDGREEEVRSKSTNFTRLIVKAIEATNPEAAVVLINSGSIRVDDVLQAPISQYDILRSLPYGGSVIMVDMKGSLLLQLLKASLGNIGSGGFLQYSESLEFDAVKNSWTLNKDALQDEKIYKVALTEFLLTGGENDMEYLKKDNPAILKVYSQEGNHAKLNADIRLVIIDYFEKLFLK